MNFILFVTSVLLPLASFAQSIGEQNLLGSWRCESYLHATVYDTSPDSFAPGWQRDTDGMLTRLPNVSLDFTAKNGAYSVTSSSPNPFLISSASAVQSSYAIKDGYLVFKYFDDGANTLYEVKSLSDTHLDLKPVASSASYPAVSCEKNAILGVTRTNAATSAAAAKSSKETK